MLPTFRIQFALRFFLLHFVGFLMENRVVEAGDPVPLALVCPPIAVDHDDGGGYQHQNDELPDTQPHELIVTLRYSDIAVVTQSLRNLIENYMFTASTASSRAAKLSAFNDAPPTSAPSTSCCSK